MFFLKLIDYIFLAGFISESVFYEEKDICIERAAGQVRALYNCTVLPVCGFCARIFFFKYPIATLLGLFAIIWVWTQMWDKIQLFYVKRSNTILKQSHYNLSKPKKRIIMILHYLFIFSFVAACSYLTGEILS